MTADALLMPHRLGLAVAGTRAVFALLVAIAFKNCAAMGAGEGIDSFPPDGFRVSVPPGHAAFI